MIENLTFGILFFDDIISGMQLFYICPHVPVDIIRFFFNSTFSNRKSQSKQLLAKKVTHFTIPFRSKILTHFTRRNSLDIEKKCYRNAAKTLFDFTYFPANMVLFGARNNICTAPFLDPQELHS